VIDEFYSVIAYWCVDPLFSSFLRFSIL